MRIENLEREIRKMLDTRKSESGIDYDEAYVKGLIGYFWDVKKALKLSNQKALDSVGTEIFMWSQLGKR